MVPVEHDHPRAGAEDRRVEPPERLVEAVEAHQPRDRGRLAARQDQPVEPVELLGQAHLDRLGAEAPQHRRVLAEVPLHGEDADSKRLLHGRIVEAATRAAGWSRRRRRSKPSPSTTKKTDDGEDERRHPAALVDGRSRRRGTDRGRATTRSANASSAEQQAERAEHRPARAPRAARDGDVDERRDRDERPVESLECHQ